MTNKVKIMDMDSPESWGKVGSVVWETKKDFLLDDGVDMWIVDKITCYNVVLEAPGGSVISLEELRPIIV